jgi:FMN phosphatase YigB (HAD superfamily)
MTHALASKWLGLSERMDFDNSQADASHTAHVGDLLRTDVAGARGVGMASIRIRAVYDDPSEQPEADLLADSHSQLREIFERALG